MYDIKNGEQGLYEDNKETVDRFFAHATFGCGGRLFV